MYTHTYIYLCIYVQYIIIHTHAARAGETVVRLRRCCWKRACNDTAFSAARAAQMKWRGKHAHHAHQALTQWQRRFPAFCHKPYTGAWQNIKDTTPIPAHDTLRTCQLGTGTGQSGHPAIPRVGRDDKVVPTTKRCVNYTRDLTLSFSREYIGQYLLLVFNGILDALDCHLVAGGLVFGSCHDAIRALAELLQNFILSFKVRELFEVRGRFAHSRSSLIPGALL